MEPYKVSSAVLFLIFNRPDTTQEVFHQIRAAKPLRLYIAADGPRSNHPSDTILCKEAKEIVNQIDWDCDIKTLFREENLGCKIAVSSAISWFFEQEEEGIILEDDCLPSDSFFYFCDQMLDTYRLDNRVRHIGGNNFHFGKTWGEASYYFSESTSVWGWASWRRVWKDYDCNLQRYDLPEVEYQMNKVFKDTYLAEIWINIFKELKENKINTWDYQLAFTNYFMHGLSVNPNVNLVSNIGFRPDATHTADAGSLFSRCPAHEIKEITHPKYFLPEKDADYAVLQLELRLEERRKKHFSLRRRFKRWLKSQF